MRGVVKPLTDEQIDLVARTFANQAVIAIENVRLFDEVQARTEDLRRSRFGNKPRPPMCLRLSVVLLSIFRRCLIRWSSRRRDYALLIMRGCSEREGELFRFVASYGHATDVHSRGLEVISCLCRFQLIEAALLGEAH